MKKLAALLLVVVVLCGCASSIQPKTMYSQGQLQYNDRVAYLTRLKNEKKYDELMFALFPDARKGGTIPRLNREENEQDFLWLRSETATPPPANVDFPIYYFFSWKLAFADVQASRLMNARGRVRLMLDASLCAKNSRWSTPWNALVEGGVFDNMQLRDGSEWQGAVNSALDWFSMANMAHVDRTWYCGPNNTMEWSEADDRYRETLRKIRQSNLGSAK